MRETIYIDACRHSHSTSSTCDNYSTHSEKATIPNGSLTTPDNLLPSSLSIETASSATLDDKRQQLSTFRLSMAHIGAALTLFLATTDATVVSTSLPTIANELHASHNQYTWVGVAYMLTQTAFQPLYGKISDLVGRKNVLYTSMAVFALGSLLCGAAKDITWLIAARALAGVGGGGIVNSVWVITAEIVEVQHRAKWSQALSITWSCSAIGGPILGGVFSQGGSGFLSWRWGFYINLPISLTALLVLLFSLRNVHLGNNSDKSWRELAEKFDFGGLILFMSGTSCIIVGFSFATDHGWTAPSTLLLIILGMAILVCGGCFEKYTTRECLFSASTFTDPTAIIILVVNFLHNFAFNAGTFYLALLFQAANGFTPLQAGIRLLPYSLGSSLASMPAAWFIGYWQRRTRDTSGQKWVICIGLLVSTLGFGLFILLDEHTSAVAQTVFPLIAGIGLGMLFHAPYQVFARAVKPGELATGTSAFFLVRFTGATVGLAVAGAIFYVRASNRMPPQISDPFMNYSLLNSIQPLTLREQVLWIVSTSIRTIWMVCSPCLGFAFLVSLLVKTMPVYDIPDNEPGTPATTKNSTEA